MQKGVDVRQHGIVFDAREGLVMFVWVTGLFPVWMYHSNVDVMYLGTTGGFAVIAVLYSATCQLEMMLMKDHLALEGQACG